MLYALCGPSGAGKSTLLAAALQIRPQLARLVTFTTRARRAGEVDGCEYHFVSPEQFRYLVQVGEIVCPVFYRDACYGTGRADLLACAQRDTLAVLLPQKLPEIGNFCPVVGIFIERSLPENRILPQQDAQIVAHRHLCAHTVHNRPGQVDAACQAILSLIAQGASYAHHAIASLP
jgi:energy-coupling factor transporter ATP-binding protein EcfA2